MRASPRSRRGPGCSGRARGSRCPRARPRARAWGSAPRRRRRRRGPARSGSRRSRRTRPARSRRRGRSARRGARTGSRPRSGSRPRRAGPRAAACAGRASGWSAGSARNIGSSNSGRRARGRGRATRSCPRTRTAARCRTRRRRVAAPISSGSPSASVSSTSGCCARKIAIASGISVAPAVGKDAIRSCPPRRPAIAAISASAACRRAMIPSAYSSRTCAGRRQPHAARQPLDQRDARLGLERGDLLGDRRLRVGERIGGGREGAARLRPRPGFGDGSG